MGNKRSFKNYMDMVGLDANTKTVTKNTWCHKGEWPQQALQYKIDKKDKQLQRHN